MYMLSWEFRTQVKLRIVPMFGYKQKKMSRKGYSVITFQMVHEEYNGVLSSELTRSFRKI